MATACPSLYLLKASKCIAYSVLITIRIYRFIPLPEDFLSDVQTDVHFVPVDSDSPIRNLLKVRTVRCALVL